MLGSPAGYLLFREAEDGSEVSNHVSSLLAVILLTLRVIKSSRQTDSDLRYKYIRGHIVSESYVFFQKHNEAILVSYEIIHGSSGINDFLLHDNL